MCAMPSRALVCPMWCRSSVSTARRARRRLACREAYPVAERFLKALHMAGGLPSPPRTELASELAERPVARSPDFTYRPSGDIIANSGVRKEGGRADFTAYSQIRFPLERAPAFVHLAIVRQAAKYRTADEAPGRKDQYPWRDNFCEARSFNVGQCPSGFGHQGRGYPAGTCSLRSDGRGRALRSPSTSGRRGPRRRADPPARSSRRWLCRSTPAPSTSVFAICT